MTSYNIGNEMRGLVSKLGICIDELVKVATVVVHTAGSDLQQPRNVAARRSGEVRQKAD